MTNTTTTLLRLDSTLKDKLRKLVRGGKKTIRELAIEAFEVHRQHYLVGERSDFEAWWSNQGMYHVFGSRTNWTKWWRAGEAIEKVRVLFGDHIDQLPLSRDALYEIAMLRPDEMALCFQDSFTRNSATESESEWKRPRKPQPLIHPKATAPSIRDWRKRWREPPRPYAERRTLPFMTIHVHSSLYDFDRAGHHNGLIGPGQAVEITQKVIDLLKPFDAFLRLDPRLERLLKGYDKRRVAAEKRLQKPRQGPQKDKDAKVPKK